MPPKKLTKTEHFALKFSICTLTSSEKQYDEMVSSFIASGFTEEDCEFIYADNTSGNEFDAFEGINRFLREARGEFIIICHQDVLIKYDSRQKLEDQIKLVEELDSSWAILGNAGTNDLYSLSMGITDGCGAYLRKGLLPSKVQSLDENFLLFKASANLAVAGDLHGFHMYGTDVVLVAECLGYSAYVIDFNLLHKGPGNADESFFSLASQVQKKYVRFFRPRYIRTTITRFFISSNYLLNLIMNIGAVKSIARLFYKFKHKLRRSEAV